MLGRTRTRAITHRRGATLAAAVLALSACSPSPERPGEGEMTGVVVSGDDSCCWPGGGVVTSANYDAITLLDPDDFVRLWTEANPDHPKGPITADHWLAQSSSFSAPLATLTENGDPDDGPAYVDLVDGRWHTAYDGDPVMVCLASIGPDEPGGESVSGRCGLVQEEPPVGVTITVYFGGIGVTTG